MKEYGDTLESKIEADTRLQIEERKAELLQRMRKSSPVYEIDADSEMDRPKESRDTDNSMPTAVMHSPKRKKVTKKLSDNLSRASNEKSRNMQTPH